MLLKKNNKTDIILLFCLVIKNTIILLTGNVESLSIKKMTIINSIAISKF